MVPTTNDFGLRELLKHKPIACSAFPHVVIYLHIILQRCINCVERHGIRTDFCGVIFKHAQLKQGK